MVAGLIVLGALIWYLFFKPYDYLVRFTAKTFPGTINQSIKLWSLTMADAKLLEQDGLNHIKQRIQFGDTTYIYQWDIKPINDSTSKVHVHIKDIDHSLKNRLTLPFLDTKFERKTVETLEDFNKKLNEHIKKFKVRVIGKEEIKPVYYAYVSFQSNQVKKANNMIKSFPAMESLFTKNELTFIGKPFIEIEHWDMANDSIRYNFCYPIKKSERSRLPSNIQHKQLEGKKALKAVYNGNYITSDRAWYALMDYAEKHRIPITGKPVEFFNSNPSLGGDELSWEAVIYMPLKTTDE